MMRTTRFAVYLTATVVTLSTTNVAGAQAAALHTTPPSAATGPPSSAEGADVAPRAAAGPRRPQRGATRPSSFDWVPDVLDRIRALDEHAAHRAERRPFETTRTAPAPAPPPPPTAVDGARR